MSFKEDFIQRRRKCESPALDPIVKSMFHALDERCIKYDEIESKIGISGATLWNWRRGKTSPTFFLLTCILGYMGLELKLIEKDSDDA